MGRNINTIDRSFNQIADRLDRHCKANRSDWGVVIERSYETGWSAEVRVTPNPNNVYQEADISIVAFKVEAEPKIAFDRAANAVIRKLRDA